MKTIVEEARRRIADYTRCTECRRSTALSEAARGEVFLKLENLQESGSFKLRGVVNKILSLSEADSQGLLVTASTGNHGAAFAHAVQLFGLQGKLFMPETAAQVKIETLRATGVPFELVGDDCVVAEVHAAAFAHDNGHVWISPYNDLEVIHGQGTVGVELIEQLGTIDAAVVPVGGGGLIGGVAGYLKAVNPSIEVIGCQPRNSCVLYLSLQAGWIVEAESLPTLSDATAGGIEQGALTLDLCRRYVDDFVLLEEEEIINAMRFLHEREDLTVEGAAAMPAAVVLEQPARFAGRRTALIVSGGRVDEETLARVVAADHDENL